MDVTAEFLLAMASVRGRSTRRVTGCACQSSPAMRLCRSRRQRPSVHGSDQMSADRCAPVYGFQGEREPALADFAAWSDCEGQIKGLDRSLRAVFSSEPKPPANLKAAQVALAERVRCDRTAPTSRPTGTATPCLPFTAGASPRRSRRRRGFGVARTAHRSDWVRPW